MAVPYEKILQKALSMREDYANLLQSASHPVVQVKSFQEVDLELVPGYKTRLLIYTPESECSVLPVYVVFHSGAFARGSAYFDEYVNSVTAKRVGCIVVAVEFQLAPEVKFPTQIMECCAAVEWVYAHAEELNADPERIAIGGHNSGGTIAAAVNHMVRDRGEIQLCCAVLDCAMYTLYSDMEELPDFDISDPLKGPVRGVFFNTCYLGDLKIGYSDPLASPLLEDDLSGLPPTLVVIAGKDAARLDSEKYFQKLKDSGNDCLLKIYEDEPHGFNVQPGLAAQAVVDESFRFLDDFLVKQFNK